MTGPARRRPGGESPISIPVSVEAVRTPATASVDVLEDVTPVAGKRPLAAEPSSQASIAQTRDLRKNFTVTLNVQVKAQAVNAVLRSAGLEGGYDSFSAFVENAIIRELDRSAAQFNDGIAWPTSGGALRPGRPLRAQP